MDSINDGSNPFMDGTPPDPAPTPKSSKGKLAISIALVAAGLVAGAAVTGTVVANAHGRAESGAESSVGTTLGDTDSAPNVGGHGPGDVGPRGNGPGGDVPPPPQDLTGDALTKVTSAVAAKYPGATVERAGQLPDGTFVAHAVTAHGETYVTLDANFAIIGELADPGGPGGYGGPDGDHGPGDGN